MPYQKKTYRETLDAVGCPELFVEILDPSSVPASERDRIQNALLIINWARYEDAQARARDPEGPGKPLDPEDRWAVGAVDDYCRRSLVAWNCPFSDEWVDMHGTEADRGLVIPLTRKARVEQVAGQLAAVKRKKEPKAAAGDFLAMADEVVPEEWDAFDPLPTEVYAHIVHVVGQRLLAPPKPS